MLKCKDFKFETDVCNFVNYNNIKVVSICPIECGKACVSHWTVFYFED